MSVGMAVADYNLPSAATTDMSGKSEKSQQTWLLVRVHTEPIGALVVAAGEDPHAAVDRKFGPAVAERRDGDFLARRAAVLRDAPPITVVVCTRDQPEALATCLDSVARQRYPDFQVLVVDNAPTSDVTEQVARARGVRYVREPRPGLSNARNRALAETGDEILAWLDDDEVADEHWLAELARGFAEHPEAGVVTGAVVPAELATAAQVWFEEFGGHSKGRGFTAAVFSPATAKVQSPLYPLPPFGAGANMAWRAAAARAIGGFDPALGAGTPAMGGEDTVAFAKVLLAGGTIAYRPAALTRHTHRRDLAGLERQLFGYGVGLTAGYTSLVLGRPALVPRLLRLAPTALRDLRNPDGARLATVGPDFPAHILANNRRGMLQGPAAYLRGRREQRRRPRTPEPAEVAA
ncbi:glycosyltransferase family 2 protein [Dactylosporangium sp. NPDC049140]|uniref:glycosyltransferase family 2 protein n=1 Tax=Dactylosporangium sp. NPDC049140 TaxID=3155647 RepID=UPI0033D2B362